MQMSKFSLYSEEKQRTGIDPISDVYAIIRDEATRAKMVDVSYARALDWITMKVDFLILV